MSTQTNEPIDFQANFEAVLDRAGAQLVSGLTRVVEQFLAQQQQPTQRLPPPSPPPSHTVEPSIDEEEEQVYTKPIIVISQVRNIKLKRWINGKGISNGYSKGPNVSPESGSLAMDQGQAQTQTQPKPKEEEESDPKTSSIDCFRHGFTPGLLLSAKTLDFCDSCQANRLSCPAMSRLQATSTTSMSMTMARIHVADPEQACIRGEQSRG